MTWFVIYLFVIADQLREALSGYWLLLVVSCIVCPATLAMHAMSSEVEVKESSRKFMRKSCYWLLSITAVMFVLHTLIPTQKNLAILIGTGTVYEVVTSEDGRRIGGKVIQMLEEKLDGNIAGDVESHLAEKAIEIETKGEKL